MPKYTEPVEEELEQNESQAKYRLPFALCKQHGIPIEKWWKPRDAWNALNGIGIHADEEYKKRLLEAKKAEDKKRSQKRQEEKKRFRELYDKQIQNPEHNPDYKYEHKDGMIAGVTKGEPMSFEQADSGSPNPHFDDKDAIGYKTNCQTCVPTFLARLQGYDVRALPNFGNGYIKDLQKDLSAAYIDKRTGKKPEYITVGQGVNRVSFMRKQIQEGEIYSLSFGWKGRNVGHVITVRKEGGELIAYDPQNGQQFKNIGTYLSRADHNIRLINLSHCDLNPEYADYIMKASESSSKKSVTEIPLKGSEKQIAWAQKIRSKIMDSFDINIQNAEKNLAEHRESAAAQRIYREDIERYKLMKEFYTKLFSMPKFSSASAIIDNRDRFPTTQSVISKAETLASNKGTRVIDEMKKLLRM